MPYLVDSDWVADFLAGRSAAIQLIQTLLPSGVSISAISYMEVVEGVRGSRNRSALAQGFHAFLQGVPVLEFSQEIADRAANIRLDLRGRKRQVNERALDILVAATAMEHGLTLVTRNTRDYVDIGGLQLYQIL